MRVESVTVPFAGAEQIKMHAVCGQTGAAGESEDNIFARYTPNATLDMTINNPALVGTIKEGMTFYVDFTEHVA